MKLKNVTLAAALLALLTGCSSSGGGGSNTPNNNQPTAQNEQALQQVADARKAEEARVAEENRKAEEARATEENRKAEEARVAEENRKAEEARIAEENRKAEEAHIAEENRKTEESRKTEEVIASKKTELFDVAKSIGLPDSIANEYAERFSKNPEQLMGDGTSESYLRSYLYNYFTAFALEKGVTEQEANHFANQNASGWSDAGNIVEKAKENMNKFLEVREAFIQSWTKTAEEQGLSHDEAVAFAKSVAIYANDDSIDDQEKYNRAASSLGRITYEKQQKAYEEEQRRIQALTLELTKLAQEAGLDEAKAQEFAQQNINTPKEQRESLLNQIVKTEREKTELFNLAKEKGLTEYYARKFAEQNLGVKQEQLQPVLDSVLVQQQADQLKGFLSERYPENEITTSSLLRSVSIVNQLTSEDSTNKTMIYNQKYSATIGKYDGSVSYNNETGRIFSDSRDISISTKGIKTDIAAIPQEGRATYRGKAFNGTQRTWNNEPAIESYLEYNVNFGNKTGYGSISSSGNETINLDEGMISDTGISSIATQGYKSGSYSLEFFGKNAEEIGGKVSFDGKDVIGFGGTRGEIQK